MKVVSLVQRSNWGRLMKKWMMIKYNPLWKSMMEIGLSGIRILHLKATCVVYGRDKFNQPEQNYHLYWKHTEKTLITLMTEVKGVLNSRPVTVKTNNDLTSFQQLFINLLTMKSKVVSPPPGKFLKPDIYSTRCWRCIQHIGNKVWSHWRK